ncbi:MAG: alanine racemase [Alphaproteobacteria bacterium]|nr:alanine racemase [Alphaproteobacteria bacterium]
MTNERSSGILTIDLDAVAANWRSLKSRLQAGTLCAAVVKADGYGLGATRIAARLYAEGCRDFFVATPDEGISLRRVLPDGAIYVLAGVDSATAAALTEHRLTPVLNHLGQIEAWRKAAAAAGSTLPSVLHLDTGMNRLGLPRDEVARVASEAPLLAGLKTRLVMSHLVSSELASDPLNETQRARFDASLSALSASLGTKPASLANSSGIFLGPAFHYAMVRPGVALYGVNPTPNAPNPMMEVLRLAAKILQVRRVDRGETVGYGATHLLPRPSRIAVVAAGYADGFLRSASNRASARLGGLSVPVVGRVSMDLITLDVTDVPETIARPGAFVDLLDGTYNVEHLATDAGTIPYEILTALGHRYERRYLGTSP